MASDKDFIKWAEHEAEMRGETLETASVAFCECLAVRWATAPILFGETWKKTLMVGCEK